MWKYITILVPICNQVFSTIILKGDNHINFEVCKNNRSIAVQLSHQDNTENGIYCECQVSKTINPLIIKDYILSPGIGLHKLHITAKNWNDARKVCNEENGHLAIINSMAEQNVLVAMLHEGSGSITGALNTEEALIGIHDLFKEGEWVTVLGESIYTTGYSHWSKTYFGGQPDNFLGNQNCGAIVKNGGMDDVFCHDKFAFICELPLTC